MLRQETDLFLRVVDFLGHRISGAGVEADPSKVEKILAWPVPRSASHVRAFLGLVRYVASFLPHLADYTTVLDPLTTKDCNKAFPEWTGEHQAAFDGVKTLVCSREVLTVPQG